MFDRIVRPRFGQSFNATTTDLNFGTRLPAVTAQTMLALCNPVGIGEGTFGYLMARTPSASGSGPRVFIQDSSGAPQIVVAFHSSGGAGLPFRSSAFSSVTYGVPVFMAFRHDGSLTAANISIYQSIISKPLAELAYDTTSDGTTAFDAGAANNFHVGNRENTDRTFNGEIYFLARWNRMLALSELWKAQFDGPLSVPRGLIFCWANDRDYGPYQLQPIRTAVTRVRMLDRYRAPLMRNTHRRLVAA